MGGYQNVYFLRHKKVHQLTEVGTGIPLGGFYVSWYVLQLGVVGIGEGNGGLKGYPPRQLCYRGGHPGWKVIRHLQF